MADQDTKTKDLLNRFADHMWAMRRDLTTTRNRLICLVTYIGEESGACPDWPPVDGSAEDVERAIGAVGRMHHEIVSLTEALEQERATSAQLREELALVDAAPFVVRNVGAHIHEEERIRAICREEATAILSEQVREFRDVAEARRPAPIPDPLSDDARATLAAMEQRRKHDAETGARVWWSCQREPDGHTWTKWEPDETRDGEVCVVFVDHNGCSTIKSGDVREVSRLHLEWRSKANILGDWVVEGAGA